jgi:hypothetical protein
LFAKIYNIIKNSLIAKIPLTGKSVVLKYDVGYYPGPGAMGC